MYCTEFQYRQLLSDGSEAWAYMIDVLPWRYGDQVVRIAVASKVKDTPALDNAINTLRVADGLNNGGVLDVDAIAVSE